MADIRPDPGRGDRRLRGGVGVLRRGVQGAGAGQPVPGRSPTPTRSTRVHRRLAGLRAGPRVSHRPGPGPLAQGQAAGGADGAVRAGQLLRRRGRSPIWPMRSAGSSTGAPRRPGCGCMARRISVRPSSSPPRRQQLLLPAPTGSLRRADLRDAEGGPGPTHRGRPRPVFGAGRADRAARGRARRHAGW